MLMPTAAALLDRIGRPGDLSLGTARPEPLGRLATGLAVLDEALGGGLPRAAGTFAALGLALGARRVRWSGGPGRLVLLEGIDARVTVARSRVGRPGQALVVRQACA